MLWFFFLVALALAFLAVTNRIDVLDGWLSRFFGKARMAYEYMREDCEDIEHELREKERARTSPDAPPSDAPGADREPARAAKRRAADGPTLVDIADGDETAADAPEPKPRPRRTATSR